MRLHEYLGYEGQWFRTQHVDNYQEEARSRQALICDHTGAIGTWAKNELPPGHVPWPSLFVASLKAK